MRTVNELSSSRIWERHTITGLRETGRRGVQLSVVYCQTIRPHVTKCQTVVALKLSSAFDPFSSLPTDLPGMVRGTKDCSETMYWYCRQRILNDAQS